MEIPFTGFVKNSVFSLRLFLCHLFLDVWHFARKWKKELAAALEAMVEEEGMAEAGAEAVADAGDEAVTEAGGDVEANR